MGQPHSVSTGKERQYLKTDNGEGVMNEEEGKERNGKQSSAQCLALYDGKRVNKIKPNTRKKLFL